MRKSLLHAGAQPVAALCCVDARKSDHAFAQMMNMPYCQGTSFYDDVRFNTDPIKTPQPMLNDPSENMELFYNLHTPEGARMNVIAAAALGCVGYGVWPSDSLDGRHPHTLRDAADFVARAEKYHTARGNLTNTIDSNAVLLVSM